MRHSKGSPKREIHGITGLPQETRKSSNKHLTLHLKELEKEQQKNPFKLSKRKEIINIRAEINEIEFKNIKNLMKPRTGSLKR